MLAVEICTKPNRGTYLDSQIIGNLQYFLKILQGPDYVNKFENSILLMCLVAVQLLGFNIHKVKHNSIVFITICLYFMFALSSIAFLFVKIQPFYYSGTFLENSLNIHSKCGLIVKF